MLAPHGTDVCQKNKNKFTCSTVIFIFLFLSIILIILIVWKVVECSKTKSQWTLRGPWAFYLIIVDIPKNEMWIRFIDDQPNGKYIIS